MAVSSIGYVVVGLVFIGLGIPLVQRRIPQNRWYGFRVAKTFSSERIWYDANEVAGRDLIVAGAVVAITAAATGTLASRLDGVPIETINLVVFVAAMIASTWHSFVALRRM